jgi:hypothetical protein
VTIVVLLFGGFVFLVGWIVGLIMLWSSRRWTTLEKLIGTLVLPGGIVAIPVLVLIGSSAHNCGPSGDIFQSAGHGPLSAGCANAHSGPPLLSILVVVLLVAAQAGSMLFLTRRARRPLLPGASVLVQNL